MISKSFSRFVVFTVHVDTKNHNIKNLHPYIYIYKYYSVLYKMNTKNHSNWHLNFCTSKCQLCSYSTKSTNTQRPCSNLEAHACTTFVHQHTNILNPSKCSRWGPRPNHWVIALSILW